MQWSRLTWASLIPVLIAAIWLLTTATERVWGVDAGTLGSIVLSVLVWTALWGIGSSTNSSQGAVLPAEWRAWIGLGFMTVIILYFMSHIPSETQGPLYLDTASRKASRNIVLLLVVWATVNWLLQARWREQVQESERDWIIDARSGAWARGALVVFIMGIAFLLGMSQPEQLDWATPRAIANLLIFALLWAGMVEYMVSALSYWKDRR